MKKIIYSISILLSFLFIFSSCTKDFEELNQNPNNPDSAPLEGVLAYSIVDLSNRFSISTELEYVASYVGHVTKSKNTDVQRYISESPTGIWSSYYLNTLTNLNSIIEDEDTEIDNFKAAAITIKAYATQIQVDAYGAVPYFDASKKNEGINKPKFDSEEAIYDDMLEQLKIANSLYSESSRNLKAADIIYGGTDVEAWKKFTNSLRLRIAIRISNVAEAKAKAVISEILNDPITYPIFESNADNAVLRFPGDSWKEPWTAGSHLYAVVAAPLIDSLKAFADPRLSKYAKPNTNGEYISIQVGEEIPDGTLLTVIADEFFENPDNGKLSFLTYSEIEFIKAEAYARGLTGSVDATKANQAYENAITANLQSLGVATFDISTYLAQPKVVYGGDVNKIYLQKWFSLFHQSWEAWAEMRRTDVPLLPVAVNSNYSGHNRVPFRFAYPQIEKDLNSENIPSSVVEDDEYWGTQIWWDTRTGVN